MNRPLSGVIPIPDFETLRRSWVQVRAAGTTLYGLLVYHASDHHFPEYVSADGLSALHLYSSGRCALFVIHSPSVGFIDYARKKVPLWAQLFERPDLGQSIE